MKSVAGPLVSTRGEPPLALLAGEILDALSAEDLLSHDRLRVATLALAREAQLELEHALASRSSACILKTRIGLFGFSEPTCTEVFPYASGCTHRACGPWWPKVTSGTRIFLSQDTYRGDEVAPPSTHRYTYVYNNPIRYTDPSGEYGITLALFVAGLAFGWSIMCLMFATLPGSGPTGCAVRLSSLFLAALAGGASVGFVVTATILSLVAIAFEVAGMVVNDDIDLMGAILLLFYAGVAHGGLLAVWFALRAEEPPPNPLAIGIEVANGWFFLNVLGWKLLAALAKRAHQQP